MESAFSREYTTRDGDAASPSDETTGKDGHRNAHSNGYIPLARAAAEALIRRGIMPMPVAYGSKHAGSVLGDGWQKQLLGTHYQLDDFNTDRLNVSTRNGHITDADGRVLTDRFADCDLDTQETIRAAPFYLPHTEMIWGRKSKPRSHYGYRIHSLDGTRTHREWNDPLQTASKSNPDGQKAKLSELRFNGHTLAPGSVNMQDGHPEHVRWDVDGDPMEVEWDGLERLMAAMNAAALLGRYWVEGIRHAWAGPLAGMLYRGGMELYAAELFMQAVCAVKREDAAATENRLEYVRDTYTKLDNGEVNITGQPELEQLGCDPKITAKLREWLRLAGGGGATRSARLDDGPVEGRALWNARFYADLYRDRLRYVPAWGRWYENNGKWWEPDQVKVATRLGYEAVDMLYRRAAEEPDRKRKRELSEVAVKLDVASNITAMVSAGGTFLPIAARADQFDREDWHVVAANGIIDLRTGDLLPHNPAALHSKHLGPTLDSIPYDPDAMCPNFLTFLAKIFPEADGPEMTGYLQRVSGYTLTGDISEQCIFILNGDGDNGKTTLTQAIGDVLGTYYDTVPPETLLSTAHDRIPNDIAKLVGVRGVFASETEQHRHLAEALIKKLTGGEEVDARFLNHEWFKFRPKFKLWLHTNHIPKVRGKDKGIWRRLRVIPFTYTFTDDEKQRDFYERVLRPELPGILAWMVRGGLEWQQVGLREPERVKAAWAAYRATSDTLKQFIDDYVYREEDSIFLPSGVVYRTYCDVCRQQGEKPESQMALSLAIKERFNAAPVLRKGEGRGFYGLDVQSLRYPHE